MDLHGVHLDASCFQLGQHQDTLDHLQQLLAAAVNLGDPVALGGTERSQQAITEGVGKADDGIERCAQFMGHGGQQRALGATRPGQRLVVLFQQGKTAVAGGKIGLQQPKAGDQEGQTTKTQPDGSKERHGCRAVVDQALHPCHGDDAQRQHEGPQAQVPAAYLGHVAQTQAKGGRQEDAGAGRWLMPCGRFCQHLHQCRLAMGDPEQMPAQDPQQAIRRGPSGQCALQPRQDAEQQHAIVQRKERHGPGKMRNLPC